MRGAPSRQPALSLCTLAMKHPWAAESPTPPSIEQDRITAEFKDCV